MLYFCCCFLAKIVSQASQHLCLAKLKQHLSCSWCCPFCSRVEPQNTHPPLIGTIDPLNNYNFIQYTYTGCVILLNQGFFLAASRPTRKNMAAILFRSADRDNSFTPAEPPAENRQYSRRKHMGSLAFRYHVRCAQRPLSAGGCASDPSRAQTVPCRGRKDSAAAILVLVSDGDNSLRLLQRRRKFAGIYAHSTPGTWAFRVDGLATIALTSFYSCGIVIERRERCRVHCDPRLRPGQQLYVCRTASGKSPVLTPETRTVLGLPPLWP